MLYNAFTNPPSTYVMYEDTNPTYDAVDSQVLARLKSEGYKEDSDEYWKKYSEYFKVMNDTLPGMFESDVQELQSNPNLGNIIPVMLPEDKAAASDSIAKYTGIMTAGDNLVIMGHSSTGSNPKYGGKGLKDWGVPEDVNCYLGACDGDKSGPAAAKALNRPVVAQNDSEFWSGARPTGSTLAEALFFNYKDADEKKYKTYKP